jgi:hypothetical protein
MLKVCVVTQFPAARRSGNVFDLHIINRLKCCIYPLWLLMPGSYPILEPKFGANLDATRRKPALVSCPWAFAPSFPDIGY